MKRTLLIIFVLLSGIACLIILPWNGGRAKANSTGRRSELVKLRAGLSQIAAKHIEPVEPVTQPLAKPIYVGSKTRDELIKERRTMSVTPEVEPLLPPISKDAPSYQVVLTTDFRAQGSSGGSVIALRDSNGDGFADQETVMASDVVAPGDAITKIVPSQLLFGRYFAITEDSELIQIDDVNGDYRADKIVAFGDFKSSTSLGVGITTAILDDGTEAVYLLRIDPGPDGLFYTGDDSCSMAVYLDRDKDNEIDTISKFFTSRAGFTSLGGFSTGVETSLLFNLGQYDNAGRVTSGAIYSYYDFNGDGIPDDFAPNNNNGIFAGGSNNDLRPAVATDIVESGTNFYVTAPLTALGLASNDDIAVYSDFNATQTADGPPIIFTLLPGLSGFSSDLGGLAVSLDGTRVAAARNQVSQNRVENSRILLLFDDNLDLNADKQPAEFFNNSTSGLAGICFSNADLLGPQPIVIFPRLKSSGKFLLDAIGARIASGAVLIVDGKEQFALRLNGSGTKWLVSAATLSSPSGLTISQVLGSSGHILVIKNPSGQESIPAFFQH